MWVWHWGKATAGHRQPRHSPSNELPIGASILCHWTRALALRIFLVAISAVAGL